MFIDISTLSTDICHNVLLSLCIYSIVSKPWNKWEIPWSKSDSLVSVPGHERCGAAVASSRSAARARRPGIHGHFMAILW